MREQPMTSSKPAHETPEWLVKLRKFRESGAAEEIKEIQKLNKSVWVMRRSGAWVRGKIGVFLEDDGKVQVIWPHTEKPGKFQNKMVDAADLLEWQKAKIQEDEETRQ